MALARELPVLSHVANGAAAGACMIQIFGGISALGVQRRAFIHASKFNSLCHVEGLREDTLACKNTAKAIKRNREQTCKGIAMNFEQCSEIITFVSLLNHIQFLTLYRVCKLNR